MPRRSTRIAPTTQGDIEDEEENIQPQLTYDPDRHPSTDDQVAEQGPRQRSRPVNASKSKSRVTASRGEKIVRYPARRDASEERDFEDGTSAALFDKQQFLSTGRPIPPEGAKTLDGVISDFHTVLHELEHTGFGLVLDTAVAVEEASGNTDEGREAATKLDLVMRQLVDAQQELLAHQQSLDSLKQSILREEVLNNLGDLYKTYVSDAMLAYNTRTTRQKYAKHKDYFKFRDRVWEVNHEDAMPPLGDVLPREDADSDIESDIEVGGMTQDYKCPLTLQPLTDPLTSKLCGHSFSAEAIRGYIAKGRGRAKCPATGCDTVLRVSVLEANEELARRAANALRRARRREEDRDENETELVD